MTRAIEVCRESGYCLAGLPGLVRLNPNIPYKTRGNGAVVFSVTRKEHSISSPRFQSGAVGDEEVISVDIDLSTTAPGSPLDEILFKKLIELVDRESHKETVNTEPGLVVTNNSFPLSHYARAVRSIYPLDDAIKELDSSEYTGYKRFGTGRGLVGCLGALSWYQNRRSRNLDHTFEILAYRGSRYWNTPRKVDGERVKLIDEMLPDTFNNFDHRNGKPLVYPNTPCPVLFGVRGNVREELPRALSILDCEEMERWQLFISNQGTDDHLVERTIEDIENYSSVITRGVVKENAREIRGGHVFINIEDGENEIQACAFEPTKGFRGWIRDLLPGDEVRLYGGVKGEEKSKNVAGGDEVTLEKEHDLVKAVNIEKMEIIQLVFPEEKVANPRCPVCGKGMKSMGSEAGFRCRGCHERTGVEEAVYRKLPRILEEGKIYEVDRVALRHLAKPLARFGMERGKTLREITRGCLKEKRATGGD